MTNLTQKIKSNSELLSNLCNCCQCQCKVYKIPASYPHLLSLLSIKVSNICLPESKVHIHTSKLAQLSSFAQLS